MRDRLGVNAPQATLPAVLQVAVERRRDEIANPRPALAYFDNQMKNYGQRGPRAAA